MDDWLFAIGAAALLQVAFALLFPIVRMLFDPEHRARPGRLLALLVGAVLGGIVVPAVLPVHAGVDVLHARLLAALDVPLVFLANLAGLAFVGFVGTWGLDQLSETWEAEWLRDVLLVTVCLLAALLVRILFDTLMHPSAPRPGHLLVRSLPAIACSVGSLLALLLSTAEQTDGDPEER